MWTRKLRPPSAALRGGVRFASGIQRGSRAAISRPKPPPRSSRRPPDAPVPPQEASSTTGAISEALRQSRSEDNNLLSPVHVPEDPNGVLNERHPATKLLANSAIVITRQLELMNVFIGFEQANKYVIMDPQGNHIGYMAEHDSGISRTMTRQLFRTHRAFTTHVFDKHEREVLRFHRPFSWINSRIRVHDPIVPASSSPSNGFRSYQELAGERDHAHISPLPLSEMRVIGEAQQQWAPLRRKYNLFLYHDSPNVATNPQGGSGASDLSSSQQAQLSAAGGDYSQFAYVDEPFLSWDFSLQTADSRLMGSVNRNFAGFGREIFTDTGVYALRMDAAGLADEPRHLISQTGRSTEVAYDNRTMGMTLDQRAVMLATAVSIDFDYFSRHSEGSGFGFMPLWFPGEATAGGTAAGEAGAAGGAAAGEAGSAAGTAVGSAARGVGGIGESAAVGAGTMAGYEAMQRGVYGNPEQQSPTNEAGAGQAPPPPPGQQPGEETWGSGKDPWGGDEGGGGGGDVDVGDWF